MEREKFSDSVTFLRLGKMLGSRFAMVSGAALIWADRGKY